MANRYSPTRSTVLICYWLNEDTQEEAPFVFVWDQDICAYRAEQIEVTPVVPA